MEPESIICAGCSNACEDPKILICGCYCDDCVDKLLQGLNLDTNEFHCPSCDENHKIPGKGFKRYNSIANVQTKKRKVCLDEVYRGKSVEELKHSLNTIKSTVDKMEFDLKNPTEFIKEHCLNQRNKIDLKFEEMIKQINEKRDNLFRVLEDFENVCIESLDKNEAKTKNIQDFLTETKEFHAKWDSYLANLKITEDQVNEAKRMAKIYENKIPIFKNKLDGFIFDENFIDFEENSNEIAENFLGNFNQSSFEKILINQHKAYCYGPIKKIYDLQFFNDNSILLTYQTSYHQEYVIQIRDIRLNQLASKNFPLILPGKLNHACTLGQFVIFYFKDNSNKYLMKFDKNLNELKMVPSAHEIKCLSSSNDKFVFMVTDDINCNIHVLNEDLLVINKIGQTQIVESPFYFSDEIKKLLHRNKKFYCLYSDKVEIVDEETGNRLKSIETQSKLIKMDTNGNIYLLDTQRAIIVIYDLNGDFLHEIFLINLPEKFDFFIDNDNEARFVLNSNKIYNSVVSIIQGYVHD